MPIYEYRCRTCDNDFETRHAASEVPSALRCPSGHDDVVKLISLFAAPGRVGASPATACGSPVVGSCGGACACHG